MTTDSRLPPPQETEPGAQRRPPRVSYFGGVTQALNIVGTIMILVMAVAVNADILGRNLFNQPVAGVTEFIGLSIVAIVFLQMANTLREDRHISNDILVHFVGIAMPRFVAAMNSVFHLIGAILMAMILIYVWPIFTDNYIHGYYQGAPGIITIPIWPFHAALIVGATATVIQFLALAWRDFRRAAGHRTA